MATATASLEPKMGFIHSPAYVLPLTVFAHSPYPKCQKKSASTNKSIWRWTEWKENAAEFINILFCLTSWRVKWRDQGENNFWWYWKKWEHFKILKRIQRYWKYWTILKILNSPHFCRRLTLHYATTDALSLSLHMFIVLTFAYWLLKAASFVVSVSRN